MDTKILSVYNLGRGTLLNSKVTVADNAHQPLKLLDQLISGLGLNSESGLWLTPLNASPLVPRVFPFDFLYLDKEHRVLETIEIAPGIEFPPYRAEVASALVLPPDTLQATKTKPGDRLAISTADEMAGIIAASAGTTAAPKPAEKRSGRAARKSPPPPQPGPEQIVAVLSTSPALPQSSTEPALPNAADRHSEPVSNGAKPPSDAALPPRPVRAVPSPVVEHHIDPEDLFSNWIVSPSVAPAWVSDNDSEPIPPRVTPERPQPPTKLAPPQPPLATSPNGISPETSAQAGPAPSPASNPPAANPPDLSTTPESQPPSPEAPVSPRLTLPQLPAANTFTASSYGMWRVSMPTAIAPVAPVSPAPPPAPPTPTAPISNTSKQTDSSTSAAPSSEPARVPKSNSPPPSRPAETPVAENPKLRTWPSDNIVKPIGRPALAQFAASIQDKLDKLEPEAPPRPAPAQRSPVPREINSPQPAVAQPPAPPSPPVPAPRPVAPVVRNSAPPSPRPAVSASTKPAAKTPSKLASQSTPTLPPPAPQPKNGAQHPSLKSRFKQWLNPTTQPSDRRGASRRYVPGMVAHYFTGGAPKPHSIADISMTGIYILTEDRWMPGTMIQMTLQKPCAKGERKQSITVLSKIVRRGSDGVAAEFVMPDGLTHWNHDIQPAQATDKFALARFL